jgi:hypothetical protein
MSKAIPAIALAALAAAALLLPSAAASSLTASPVPAIADPFKVEVTLVDGVPVLSYDASRAACSLDSPSSDAFDASSGEPAFDLGDSAVSAELGELDVPGVGIGITCDPVDSIAIGVPCVVGVWVVTMPIPFSLGYAGARCGTITTSCYAWGGDPCVAETAGLSQAIGWSCYFYLRAAWAGCFFA